MLDRERVLVNGRFDLLDRERYNEEWRRQDLADDVTVALRPAAIGCSLVAVPLLKVAQHAYTANLDTLDLRASTVAKRRVLSRQISTKPPVLATMTPEV